MAAVCTGIFLFTLFVLPMNFVDAIRNKDIFPKRANYFLKWEITDAEAVQLAKWDLLILDMETQEKSRPQIQKIRSLNPNIILLAYITPQEIRQDAGNSYSTLRRELFSNIPESWYLRGHKGEKVTWWPGTWLLNVTPSSPLTNGERLNDYIPRFVSNRILSTGLWDGVFYDNAWESVTHFVGANIDLNNDGVAADFRLDALWQAGMKHVYNETRRLTNNKYLIVGNGGAKAYRDELNGNLMENFVGGESWTSSMQTYSSMKSDGQGSRMNIVNVNTGNRGGQNNYKTMRFGLASILLSDGYYSFDYGDQDHSQTWYYDEYDTDLGKAVGNSISVAGKKDFAPDVWKREFENGMAIVNSTASPQEVQLGAEYEKIHGTQDTTVNDGSIVTETTLDGYDGLILLKTTSNLNDVLFTNGSFVRFLRPNGDRVRNGYYASEVGYREGGDQIAHIDLDTNGKRDLVVVTKNKIFAWRDDGEVLMKVFPYSASYRGNLHVSIGDFDGDGMKEIVVAPSLGFALPIKMYNRDGSEKITPFFPFGSKYSGGLSVDVENGFLVVGAGSNREPLVQVYDDSLKLMKQWNAFEKSFRGGVSVALGDVDGDGVNEVVVGAGIGKKPFVKTFTLEGKEKYRPFLAYTAFGNPGIEVRIADVDFDGKNDIVAFGDGM